MTWPALAALVAVLAASVWAALRLAGHHDRHRPPTPPQAPRTAPDGPGWCYPSSPVPLRYRTHQDRAA